MHRRFSPLWRKSGEVTKLFDPDPSRLPSPTALPLGFLSHRASCSPPAPLQPSAFHLMNFGYKFRVKDSGAQSPSHPLFPLSSPSSPPPPTPTPLSPLPLRFPPHRPFPSLPAPSVLRSHFISRTISSIRVGAACSLRLRCQLCFVCLSHGFIGAFCSIPEGGAARRWVGVGGARWPRKGFGRA